MIRNFTAKIKKSGMWYVATCIETAVTTQGRTHASAKKNLREAMMLYLEKLPDHKARDLSVKNLRAKTMKMIYA